MAGQSMIWSWLEKIDKFSYSSLAKIDNRACWLLTYSGKGRHRTHRTMSVKTVLEKGGGLLQPNELSTALLNVEGKLVSGDGAEHVFERQENVKHFLGISKRFNCQLKSFLLTSHIHHVLL